MAIDRTFLIEKRKEKKFNQSMVAKRANVSQAQLSRFENGGDVYLSTAENIAMALDLKLIAIPKELTAQVELLLKPYSSNAHTKELSLLEKYRIDDSEDEE